MIWEEETNIMKKAGRLIFARENSKQIADRV